MDANRFCRIAEEALNALPLQFRALMENVVIMTEELADPDTLQQMQIDSPYDLLGLYEGRPITERESVASGELPDLIHLYRQPILAHCAAVSQPPEQCISEVLIHEIGHHFGFSDAEMARIEAGTCESDRTESGRSEIDRSETGRPETGRPETDKFRRNAA